MGLENRCALVTGGSRGIGKAIAVTLAGYGADIALNYLADEEGKNLKDAKAVAERITSLGRKVVLFEADVSDFEGVSAMVKKVLADFGKIDILVNNAGILRDRTLKKMALEEWRSVIEVNLGGVFNCCRAAIEPMGGNGWGRIINLSSISGARGYFGQTNYSASKAGVMGFTKSLAREVAAKNITVNAVAPGITETAMAEEIAEAARQEILKQIPLGRFARPGEVAELVAFLASDKAGYITGQIIHINGGDYM